MLEAVQSFTTWAEVREHEQGIEIKAGRTTVAKIFGQAAKDLRSAAEELQAILDRTEE